MAVPSAADWIAGLEAGRVTWGGDWHEIAPGVFAPSLPLRLDGVFWEITARDLQRVADAWGAPARLLTPLVADLIRDQAAVRLDFVADRSSGHDDMADESASRRYSASLDRALRDRGVDPDGRAPLCCLGAKDWVLTFGLQRGINPYTGARLPPSKVPNYGAFTPGARSLSVSGRWHLIQSPGYEHNGDHRDYSQLARLLWTEPGATVPARDGCTISRLPGGSGGELAALGMALAALGLGIG